MTPRFRVGAGLLAKAVVQPTSMLNVRPYSRASPLPQGYSVNQVNSSAGRHWAFHPHWRQAAA
ncbi:hypothetical protein DZG01_19800 [Pseudomonas fluorescens]|nr:hypothetical protein C0J56_24145 [Pseudomonas fluorescens]AXP07241.1 hypothetical protein DZG01_19800 [Pseudomonas fluorescens]